MVDVELTVGCRSVDVTDTVQGARVPLALLYPSRAPARATRFGPYTLDVAVDAPVVGDRLALAVISHGNGGSPWTYRDLAACLARAGFVVALPEHPGNSRSDNSLAGTPANLANRPRHVRLVIDAAFADGELGARLEPGVAVIGHSIGAYTALAVAGGQPIALPEETPDGRAHPVPVVADPRVRALVLFAPAAPWFMADGALAGVDAPILMFSGERDQLAPLGHAEIIARGLRDPARLDHRIVAGAGHFSFQSPFPPEMVTPSFPPAHDPEGFDRAAFVPVLCADVLAFLRA